MKNIISKLKGRKQTQEHIKKRVEAIRKIYEKNPEKWKICGFYKNNNNYSKKEIEILRKFYPYSTKKEILELLPTRKYRTIIVQAHRLGIKKTKETLFKSGSEGRKGIKWNENSKKERVKLIKKLWQNPEYREHMSKVHRKYGTDIIRRLRNHYKYRQWVNDVFTRDNFTCQKCGNIGSYLEAHHINKFSDIFYRNHIKTFEEGLNCSELWNINNGSTLCEKCHLKTDNYGNRKMTISQA